MLLVDTKYFGTMTCEEESAFDFPLGLPGFEDETRFVFIEIAEHAPLVFLQSLNNSSLCFLALPVPVIDPHYDLSLSAEDCAALELPAGCDPKPEGALVLALVSLHDGFSATANLMAPVVVNVRRRRALQSIRVDRVYSHQHPVPAAQYSEGVC